MAYDVMTVTEIREHMIKAGVGHAHETIVKLLKKAKGVSAPKMSKYGHGVMRTYDRAEVLAWIPVYAEAHRAKVAAKLAKEAAKAARAPKAVTPPPQLTPLPNPIPTLEAQVTKLLREVADVKLICTQLLATQRPTTRQMSLPYETQSTEAQA